MVLGFWITMNMDVILKNPFYVLEFYLANSNKHVNSHTKQRFKLFQTLAVSSSQVSIVSQAERRSDSPNSYFLDQPRGA